MCGKVGVFCVLCPTKLNDQNCFDVRATTKINGNSFLVTSFLLIQSDHFLGGKLQFEVAFSFTRDLKSTIRKQILFC